MTPNSDPNLKPYIIRRNRIPIGDGLCCDAHLISFDPLLFHASLFLSHNIALPLKIAQSAAKRQAEFFYGRLAAKVALNTIGINDWQIPIGHNGQPLWPRGVTGSISHTLGRAIAIAGFVDKIGSVGIDVEWAVTDEACFAIQEIVISPPEAAYLDSLTPRMSINDLITLAFSAKESFFKAMHEKVGSFIDFHVIAINRIQVDEGSIYLQLTRPIKGVDSPNGFYRVRYATLESGLFVTSIFT